MPSPTSELRDFHDFLSAKLGNGRADLSPEEALDEWRRFHPDENVSDEDLAAVKEALDDVADGDRGVPWEEFDRDFRKRHGLPNQP